MSSKVASHLVVFVLGQVFGVFVARISLADLLCSENAISATHYLNAISATHYNGPKAIVNSPGISASFLSSHAIPQHAQTPFWTVPRDGLRPVFVFSKASQPSIKSYSQVGQDVLILKLFEKHVRTGGEAGHYFIDLASNNATTLSNTLHLEQKGWQGLCIEPNSVYWYGLSAFRKCLVVGAFVGGSKDGTEVNVSLSNGAFGGIIGDEFDNRVNTKKQAKRNLLTISTLLSVADTPKIIDYLSLDVEGAEHIVMGNFPFHEYKFRFATVERPKKKLRSLFEEHGYIHANFTLCTWGETLWYHPDYIKLSKEDIYEIAISMKDLFSFTWKGYPGA